MAGKGDRYTSVAEISINIQNNKIYSFSSLAEWCVWFKKSCLKKRLFLKVRLINTPYF